MGNHFDGSIDNGSCSADDGSHEGRTVQHPFGTPLEPKPTDNCGNSATQTLVAHSHIPSSPPIMVSRFKNRFGRSSHGTWDDDSSGSAGSRNAEHASVDNVVGNV